MNQSLCIERITHFGRGRLGGKFCRASRKRCRSYKAFFCMAHDLVRFVMVTVLGMFLMMEDS